MSAGREQIARAVRELSEGRLVAFPTETVYGLGADAFDERAVRRVFELKGRPATNPLIVHVSGIEMARRVVSAWTGEADRLARAFWPGPLTLVLAKASDLPEVITSGGPTVGVRCPDHPVALALIEGLGSPIVGPSANRSGSISPTRPEHVREAFEAHEAMVLEGGPCRAGIESTVVSLVEGVPRVLRPGVIGAGEVRAVLGLGPAPRQPGEEEADDPADSPDRSPGVRGPHYRPRVAARLIDPGSWPSDAPEPARVVLMTDRADPGAPTGAGVIRMPSGALEYAAALYAALHDADRAGVDLLLIERPGGALGTGADAAIWRAIMDRLERAVAPGARE